MSMIEYVQNESRTSDSACPTNYFMEKKSIYIFFKYFSGSFANFPLQPGQQNP